MANIVGILYDRMTDDVKAQITRDFLLLGCEFRDIAFLDKDGAMDSALMAELEIPRVTEGKPTLYIVYKTGKEWPDSPSDVVRVERDLCPSDVANKLDPTPRVGYYLKPQGRTGANLTERYLNRSYPKGKGFVNQWMLHMWG